MAKRKSKKQKPRKSKKHKQSNWLKWILYLVGGIVGVFVLLVIIGLMVDVPPDVDRPAEGTSFATPVVIDESDPIRGMAKSFAHLEAYACLTLGGRVEISDRGLVEKPDHDYYVFTVTCVNGEEKFYFQVDNLSWAFKESVGDGSSIENAIVLQVDPSLGPTEKHGEGIRLTYVYLRAYACEGKDGIQLVPDGNSQWIDQALIEHEGEFYDKMTVHCGNKEHEDYFFLTYLKGLSI